MLEIEKYKKRKCDYDIPDMTYTQVDTNLTSIATLLIVIDSLKEGESITITKKGAMNEL